MKSAEKAEKAEKSVEKKLKKVKKDKTPKKAAEDAGEPLVVGAAEVGANLVYVVSACICVHGLCSSSGVGLMRRTIAFLCVECRRQQRSLCFDCRQAASVCCNSIRISKQVWAAAKDASKQWTEPVLLLFCQTAAAPKKALLIPIAKPLADEKLSKKVLKLAKKATKRKQIKRGVKEVVKAIRKKFTG